MGLQSECQSHGHSHDHDHGPKQYTTLTDRYLYGIISVVALWFISQSCVILVSRFKSVKHFLINSLRSLALGTLLSDALMHLIPSALGVHGHGDDGDDHDGHAHGSHDEVERHHLDPAFKMAGVMLSNWKFNK
jgi:hypothetical protein